MPVKKRYTDDMEKELVAAYSGARSEDERTHIVHSFMEKWNRSEKSVIAKLAKMDVYIKPTVVSKVTGGQPITKDRVVTQIEMLLGADPEELVGLDKAPKQTLLRLKELLNEN